MERSMRRGPAMGGGATWGALLAALALGLAGCDTDDGGPGAPGPPGPPGPPGDGGAGSELEPGEDPPGLQVAILGVSGATGPEGNFQPGDALTVTYTLRRDDGTSWDPAQMDRGNALVSGPTFNYQRVLEDQDVLASSVSNGDGSFSFTFPTPLPDVYLPPYNDTPAFGPGDGELTGQPLLGGTYTVGMYFRWPYTVGEESYAEVGDATFDFLLGGASDVATRAVVGQDNCNQCHVTPQAHGGQRRNVTLCLLCHTAGAEDRNDPDVEGGTPGASIEFSVMVHKIHAGRSLPSVLGMGTLPDGTRDYGVPPRPYRLVGFNDTVHDYSGVGFPVWPNRSFPLPRDAGHSSLSPEAQAKEDAMRSGAASCHTCHGDPDGAGPIAAPAQGELVYSQLKRRTCGACHDDWDWTLPYLANGTSMPAQTDDSTCTLCHAPSGTTIAVRDAHLHPMNDPSFDPGIELALLAVGAASPRAGRGNVQPGDRLAVEFTVTDIQGADVEPGFLGDLSAVVSGPTSNSNLLLNATIPSAALTGAQPYSLNLPERLDLEPVGTTTAGPDEFVTRRAPHWDLVGATTDVFARTGTSGGDSVLAAAVVAPANFVDVLDSSGFERDDHVVIDDAPALGLGVVPEEYLRIQWVDGDRLWFSSPYSPSYPPGPRSDHGVGATVREVQLTQLAEGTDYTLDASTGTIAEIAFTDGQRIVVSYTSDFVVPDVYPLALNDGPTLGDSSGKWTGKSLVDGTYGVGLWGGPTIVLNAHGEANSYSAVAEASGLDFLLGSATELEPYALIDSDASCLACHQDLYFHGGRRRGYLSCVLCHGTAGSEDRPRYVAPGAPETTGLTVEFRTMLHKIHHGEALANASTYTVVGFGQGYPDNFSEHTYGDVVYPALPDGTQDCASCHGPSNHAWQVPAPRDHPTEQATPTAVWAVACGSCHDSDTARLHIASQTTPSGIESCAVCHDQGDELSVPNAHQVR